jgi:hypothetical protein
MLTSYTLVLVLIDQIQSYEPQVHSKLEREMLDAIILFDVHSFNNAMR